MKSLKEAVNFKAIIPHLIAVALFAGISLTYMSPILDGKELMMMDHIKYLGMSKEVFDHRDETGEEALWTNSMFGGMPAFQISVLYSNNISTYIRSAVRLLTPFPADLIFTYLFGFYILMLVLGARPWLSIIGAIAFAFSSYHFIIIEAGHVSKIYAIGYMAPVLAGFILALRGKYIAGGALTALFLALHLRANHLQITYYFLFILFAWGVAEVVRLIREDKLKDLIRSALVLLAAVIIAVGVNIGNIWSTYTYTQYTMRGPSELTLDKERQSSGLDKEYATAWSYGVGETFSLLIPNTKGGATGALANNRAALEQVDPRMRQDIAGQNHYWGDQPFTSGPVYAGAIVMFLFVLSLMLWKNPLKWYLLAATILSIMLGWGKNFMPLTDFFLDYFPGYNKFRAVSMTLVIAEFCIPVIAFMGMMHFFKKPDVLKSNMKKIYIAFGLTGGISLIFYALPTTFFTFFSQMELSSLYAQKAENPSFAAQIDMFMKNLEAARVYIFRADAIRSFIFITLGAVALLLYVKNIINKNILLAALGVLILTDMWAVNKRYLNNSNFVEKHLVDPPYRPNEANLQILQDPDPHFRVFNVDGNPFNESATAYFHSSIGGYHGAKLQRYQDIIDYHLGGKGGINMAVLNMLNTKYFIRQMDGSPPIPMQNPDALGNAWFVKDFKIVENADEEILALNDFEPATMAIIDKRFKDYLEDFTINYDTNATIHLKSYAPNKMVYATSSQSPQLAVFSEIYYPLGWEVAINGEVASYFRVNYILRAMIIPEGDNEIVFEFRPRSYYVGQQIALVFSILMVIFLISALYIQVFKKTAFKKKT